MRIPKGVRVGGKAVGGRFVSPGDLAKLTRRASDAKSARALAKLAARESAKVVRATQRAADKYVDKATPQRRQQLRELQRHAAKVTKTATAAESAAAKKGAFEQGQKPRRKRKLRKRSGPGLGIGPSRVRAVEWEIAAEYRRTRRGKGADVDVNIRIRRDDGETMDDAEALGVFRFIQQDGGVVPPGYEMMGINWRRPTASTRKQGWRSGDDDDLRNLWAPLYVAQSFRVGAVSAEEDE